MDGPLQGPPTCRTRYAKVVVTDDQGRYVVPDLPKAKYKVWVRGYGLVDSPKVDGEPRMPPKKHPPVLGGRVLSASELPVARRVRQDAVDDEMR